MQTSIGTTIKFHPHGDVVIPASWMNANECCRDRRCDIVMDNRISVAVSLEYLKAKHKIINRTETLVDAVSDWFVC